MSKKQHQKIRRGKRHSGKNKFCSDRKALGRTVAVCIAKLCAPLLARYSHSESGEVDGGLLWQMGMLAWNAAVSGTTDSLNSGIRSMHLSAEREKSVRKDLEFLIRMKNRFYARYACSVRRIGIVDGVRLIVDLDDGPVAREAQAFVGFTFSSRVAQNVFLSIGTACMPATVKNGEGQTSKASFSPEEMVRLRKAAGLTQARLAEAMGVQVRKLSLWERGLDVPDAGILEKWKDFLKS